MPVNKFKPVGANADAQEVEHDIHGDGGSTVVANPELSGDEEVLEGLEIDGTKYKVPQPSEPVASLKLFKHVFNADHYVFEVVSANPETYEDGAAVLADETVIKVSAVKKDVSREGLLLKNDTGSFNFVDFTSEGASVSVVDNAEFANDVVTEIVNPEE